MTLHNNDRLFASKSNRIDRNASQKHKTTHDAPPVWHAVSHGTKQNIHRQKRTPRPHAARTLRVLLAIDFPAACLACSAATAFATAAAIASSCLLETCRSSSALASSALSSSAARACALAALASSDAACGLPYPGGGRGGREGRAGAQINDR